MSQQVTLDQTPIRTLPTPQLRPSKLNYRPDKTKKDVVISSTGITRNASRFVDTISNGRNKYVDTQEFAPSKYKVAAAVQDMESSERQEFWAKNHVEIQIPIAALVLPNGGDEIYRIVRHMDSLGEAFTHHLENVFINMSFPTESTHDSSTNVFEVQSIKALQPLVEKLKTFKKLKFTCINIITRNSGDTPCLWEWLQYAAPFGYLPYQWHLYWLPGFQQGRIRIKPATANYRYVNEQFDEYYRQHEAYLSSPQIVIPSVFRQQQVQQANNAGN